jgi:hypothetical protein
MLTGEKLMAKAKEDHPAIPQSLMITFQIPAGMNSQNVAFLRRTIHRLIELFQHGQEARAEGDITVDVKMQNGLCIGKLRRRSEWTEELNQR